MRAYEDLKSTLVKGGQHHLTICQALEVGSSLDIIDSEVLRQ